MDGLLVFVEVYLIIGVCYALFLAAMAHCEGTSIPAHIENGIKTGEITNRKALAIYRMSPNVLLCLVLLVIVLDWPTQVYQLFTQEW